MNESTTIANSAPVSDSGESFPTKASGTLKGRAQEVASDDIGYKGKDSAIVVEAIVEKTPAEAGMALLVSEHLLSSKKMLLRGYSQSQFWPRPPATRLIPVTCRGCIKPGLTASPSMSARQSGRELVDADADLHEAATEVATCSDVNVLPLIDVGRIVTSAFAAPPPLSGRPSIHRERPDPSSEWSPPRVAATLRRVLRPGLSLSR
ncbi:hypothetical protein BDK51DRAFT_26816 [Blyttiomyces helicus]|uniref:Uncharacterized protein n=1 Tax=Blyttiomyces helicus TaxID=388810 RepID=A0A4P9W6D4_9FUNG|nr:hypothetical protein BDK51DRAFT_26816 [Blyttiomyces helicus]|eukprot:RKO86310.1 hypothetical protein BDK51DRAFT_26816 [Blyttiomyces helicus]